MPRVKHTALAFLGTLFLCTVSLAGGVALSMLRVGAFDAKNVAASVPYPTLATSTPKLTAKAAILFDPSNGRILFSKNPTSQLPLASLTKLMTAEIVLSAESPDTVVRITKEALEPEGDWGFKVGDEATLYQLIKIGLIASSNDAMQAAAGSFGANYVERMNQVAQTLGFTQTYFLNPTGLDINVDTAGAYGSPYDVARLTALFYKQYPAIFELTQESSVSIFVDGRVLTAHATALPLLAIPGFIGAKTGYTDLAGGNVAAIFDVEIGHPLIAVVLGSTKDGRFEDIKTLVSLARNNL